MLSRKWVQHLQAFHINRPEYRKILNQKCQVWNQKFTFTMVVLEKFSLLLVFFLLFAHLRTRCHAKGFLFEDRFCPVGLFQVGRLLLWRWWNYSISWPGSRWRCWRLSAGAGSCLFPGLLFSNSKLLFTLLLSQYFGSHYLKWHPI